MDSIKRQHVQQRERRAKLKAEWAAYDNTPVSKRKAEKKR
jgi:hypothetical protein